MIEISSIHKQFEDKKVLDDINATFENGVTNLIIGQSGAGKTVLMKCIVGLLRPNKGKVAYDGRDITTLKPKEMIALRREIGMLFQNAALFDSMTVLENVMFPLDMFSSMTYKEPRQSEPHRRPGQAARGDFGRYAKTRRHCARHSP